MKEIEDDTKKWEDILCSWIEIINVVKCPSDPKQSTDLMQSLSKYHDISQRTKTNNPKFYMEP